MKKILIKLLLLLMLSCNSQKENFVFIDLAKATVLEAPDIIYSFLDKYPFAVTVRDSIVYAILIRSDTSLVAISLETQQLIQSFGVAGHGPGDILAPAFISTIGYKEVLLQDAAAIKFKKIGTSRLTSRYIIEEYMDCPNLIFRSGETNISENFIAGRRVGTGKMLYIYDRNANNVIDIDYFPSIKTNPSVDLNYIYAPTIALNEKRNRIIAGMFFFDKFHLYDLEGQRINSFSFSKNPIPSFSRYDLQNDIVRKSNFGIIRSFPTKNYCYLLRIRRDQTANMLIQLNWEGELVNAYIIPDDVQGQFYIDEENNKLYIVRHRIVSDSEEVFEIVAYLL
jgi:hypothetical protein